MTAGAPPNWNWITETLAVGGGVPSEHWTALREQGVRRVVDLRDLEQDDPALLRTHGLELLLVPTPDMCSVDPHALRSAVEWVCEGLERNEKTLVHCQEGVGRSAMLALCVLIAKGETPSDALERAKNARWQVSPSPTQLQAVLDFTRSLHEARGTTSPSCGWHDLARIAYRHIPGWAG